MSSHAEYLTALVCRVLRYPMGYLLGYLRFIGCCAVGCLSATSLWAADVDIVVRDSAGAPVANAVAYLLPNDTTQALPKPRAASIDQVDRTFVPLVSVIQSGTAVTFPNSDNIRHQVYSFSPAKVFNLKLYSGKPASPVVFDQAGAVVLGCNIHDQMTAWVLVVDTPWFAKSTPAGELLIKAVPDGNYTLKFWHPGQHQEISSQSLRLVGTAVVERTVTMDVDPVAALLKHGMPGHDMAGH